LAPSMRLEIVTPERVIYSDEVDAVVAPGTEGQLGILPHHAPLMTILQAGELRVMKNGDETCIAVFGGFLEVRPDRVIVLADAAERAEEIDATRAEDTGLSSKWPVEYSLKSIKLKPKWRFAARWYN